MKATPALNVSNKFSALDCKVCQVSKAKRQAIPKSTQNHQKDILEVFEMDVQGPFQIVANDETTSNLKFIDSKSGWLYFNTKPELSAHPVLNHFINFKTRAEKQTGKSIKRVRTDQGTSFMDEFLSYLHLSGMIMEKGFAPWK